MPNPTLPATELNRIKAPPGQDKIQSQSPIDAPELSINGVPVDVGGTTDTTARAAAAAAQATADAAVSGQDYEFKKLVTGYVGGGATNLDGIPTVGQTFGLVQFVHATDGLRSYHLVAGTDAEASPGIIRPDDFDEDTNAFVWESV